ncbi:glycosyltransferase family 2 protein [Novosphingobium sp.]|uniref:glycosyltransferase family 2 protein n=1 Tax=Novosphingobium sp. TaxID=1874826 RepID=UPI0025E0E47E|nr:glycosyltransferase family 2 protein [Novosphingobium sp.]
MHDLELDAQHACPALYMIRGSSSLLDDGSSLRFSVIIANYNYGRFITDAIRSALDQDWPSLEVIVVDDGSTDDSRTIISSYGSRVQAIFQANQGQRCANNAGFAMASGDVVVFLDADDVLAPDFASCVAAAWRSGLSKVQVQMMRVGADRQPLGIVVPAIASAPSAAQVRNWMMTTGEYPTPPGSGNAYARDFLDKFFPIGADCDSSTDSTCLAYAPLLGEVETVLRPLAEYRIHGTNDSSLAAAADRFGREIARAYLRHQNAESVCRKLGLTAPEAGCLRRGRHLLQLRAASLRSAPQAHPAVAGGWWATLADAIRSLLPYGIEGFSKRLLVAGWSAATLLAPQPLARILIARRFARSG